MKFNGKNYLLWAKVLTIFLGAHRKLKHIIEDPPFPNEFNYEDWFVADYGVISWLVNSMEKNIALGVMFLTLIKRIWDTLKETWSCQIYFTGV